MADIRDFTGIWRSSYRYPSTGRNGELTDERYVRLRREGKHLIFESLPGSPSYILLRLTLDGNIATGSWQEETNPAGYYKGALYHGVIQLVVDKDDKRMHGQWLGYSKDEEINMGPWEFTYVGEKVPEALAVA